MPELSVVIPTFNRRKKVERAIRSALEQTRRPDEIIVVDDGSTDETVEFIRSEFGSAVVVLSQPNGGVSSARNTGIRHAEGDLIAFLDSDDAWLPEKLETQLPLMENDAVVLSATNWKFDTGSGVSGFDDLEFQGDSVFLDSPLQHLSRFEGHKIWLPSWIVRKQALERVGCFDERMRVAEDTRVLLRLAFEGGFALSTKVYVLRSSAVDHSKLSRPGEADYHADLAMQTCELLSEAYIRSATKPKEIRQRLGQLLAYSLRRQAQYACMNGEYKFARQKAKEVLALSPRKKDFYIASMIIVSPNLVGRRERSRLSNADDGQDVKSG